MDVGPGLGLTLVGCLLGVRVFGWEGVWNLGIGKVSFELGERLALVDVWLLRQDCG